MRMACIAIFSVLTAAAQVSPPKVIVVEGSVAKPGVYAVLDPVSGNTVRTALAQAGGLVQYADHKAFIIRVDDQGVKHVIHVPLWDIMNRKKPDITLQPGDILQVPEAPRRRDLRDIDPPALQPIAPHLAYS